MPPAGSCHGAPPTCVCLSEEKLQFYALHVLTWRCPPRDMYRNLLLQHTQFHKPQRISARHDPQVSPTASARPLSF